MNEEEVVKMIMDDYPNAYIEYAGARDDMPFRIFAGELYGTINKNRIGQLVYFRPDDSEVVIGETSRGYIGYLNRIADILESKNKKFCRK